MYIYVSIYEMGHKGVVHGMKIRPGLGNGKWEVCAIGKTHRWYIPKFRCSGHSEGLLDLEK